MTSHAEHNSRSPRHFSHRITIVIVAQAQHREHGEFDLAGDLARSSPMEIRSALGLTVPSCQPILGLQRVTLLWLRVLPHRLLSEEMGSAAKALSGCHY